MVQTTLVRILSFRPAPQFGVLVLGEGEMGVVFVFRGFLVFSYLRLESSSGCRWSLKAILLSAVMTTLHLACAAFVGMLSVAAWIVCRVVWVR